MLRKLTDKEVTLHRAEVDVWWENLPYNVRFALRDMVETLNKFEWHLPQ